MQRVHQSGKDWKSKPKSYTGSRRERCDNHEARPLILRRVVNPNVRTRFPRAPIRPSGSDPTSPGDFQSKEVFDHASLYA